MKNQYRISIENPCQKMQAIDDENNQGPHKFCLRCAKTVIDFTNANDTDIVSAIRHSTGKVCGRLLHQQMEEIPGKHTYTPLYPLVTLLGGLLFTATGLTAQPIQVVVNHVQVQLLFDEKRLGNEEHGHQGTDSLKLICGRVVDEYSNEPLETTVSVKGTNLFARTDSSGNFTLSIPAPYSSDTLVLVLPASGWERNTEVLVFAKDLPIYNLLIKKESPMIGEISYKVKRKWWQFWKKKWY